MSHKIILVDDDPVARIYMSEALEVKGFSPTVFDSGHSALGFIQENKVELAIIDTYMPGMSGIEFFAKLKESRMSSDAKVIIMSADRDCFDLLTKANLKADKVLLKPIKVGDLMAALNELL